MAIGLQMADYCYPISFTFTTRPPALPGPNLAELEVAKRNQVSEKEAVMTEPTPSLLKLSHVRLQHWDKKSAASHAVERRR
jgi:hypothetical protein